jgi:3-phenylpropionate/trans-cinnamate dioxygenase ferredoxin reductase subunit
MSNVVVIGAGQAGAALVMKLRKIGYKGEITLIGDEEALPYQRPPLSKGYLLGDMSLERLFLRPQKYYDDNDITLKLGAPVTGVNSETQKVSFDNEELSYDQLVLATGSKPLLLPASIGGNLEGVYSVRNLNDVDLMEPEFRPGRTVLIVGGGYIGLEAAAVASKKGLKVILVEMADRILQRVAATETADYFRTLHRNNNVDIREGFGLKKFIGDKRVTGAILSDSSEINVDFVISGIGISPNILMAEKAGVEIDNGIKTDKYGKTSVQNIWSAGDCASLLFEGRRIRLESVQNAIDQAECVAENIMGNEKEYNPKPWFWSDQYETKLQIAGLNYGYNKIVTRIGENTSISYWYYKDDKLLAVDAMNDPRSYMVGKRLIEMGKSPKSISIEDTSLELKSLLKP